MDWSMNLPSLVRIHKKLSHRFNLPFISDSHLSKRIIHTIKDFFSKYFQFFRFFSNMLDSFIVPFASIYDLFISHKCQTISCVNIKCEK